MVYVVRERDSRPTEYIISVTTKESAERMAEYFQMLDRASGEYGKDKYEVWKRDYCFADYSDRCGHCNACICMLEDPAKDCPVSKKRSVLAAGGECADQPALAPGA